jgi:hypothetical protein
MTTLCYITARKNPHYDWLIESLNRCGGVEHISQLVIVDRYAEAYDEWTQDDVERRRGELMRLAIRTNFSHRITYTPPKPNIWNGKFRLTPRDWWDAGNYRNTALCLAKHDFIAFLDDRCVLATTFIDAIREAQQNQYVVCGTYEKRTDMVVNDGLIVTPGVTIGKDSRAEVALGRKMICPGTWMFGCAFGLPTEMMLNVNGVDESWGSVSMEDTHFGQMLDNNGYTIYHDPRMAVIQDRSVEAQDHGMKRSSKEKHPNDKSDKTHRLIEMLWNNKRAGHAWDVRKIREDLRNGIPWPIQNSPLRDWFDGQWLKEMD